MYIPPNHIDDLKLIWQALNFFYKFIRVNMHYIIHELYF